MCRDDWASVWLEDVGNGLDGLFSVEGLMCKGLGWYWVAEYADEFLGGLDCYFCWGGEWHVDFLREKIDSICDSFGSCFVDVYAIAPIVIGCRSQVRTFDAMGIPRALLVGFFVNDYLGAWGARGVRL
jgi:hypothetical protein